jgi:hypothetical protein
MNTLEIQGWSSHSLDENLEPLEVPYSEATLIIDNKPLYIKGNKELVKQLIELIQSQVKEDIKFL